MAQQLNIFTRFLEIWKPTFLKTFLKEKTVGPTIRFYLFWSFIISVIIAVTFTVTIAPSVDTFISDFSKDVPEFSINFDKGVLSTEDLIEPYFLDKEGFIIIVDTKTDEYTETSLNEYPQWLLIKSDKAFIKKNNIETREISFAEIDESFNFSKIDIISFIDKYKFLGFVLLSIFSSIVLTILNYTFTFIVALWWALLVWLIWWLLSKTKGLDFGKSYLLVLNFYIIVFLIEALIAVIWYPILFSTTVIFTILVWMNVYSMKK